MPIMTNSKLPDQWIVEAMRTNPPMKIIDEATGQWTGSITTPPCRLSYPSLFKPEVNRQTGQTGKFKATLLFPPGADLSLLISEYHAAVARFFPGVTQYNGNYAGLHPPFKDQGAKLPSPGYNANAWAITVSTAYKPKLCDPAMNIIVDETRVYPGVWAIAAVSYYQYGVRPPQPKKGVNFGLMSMMIIADDEHIGGSAGIDPHKAFAKTSVTPNFNAAAAFGAPGGNVSPFPATAGGLPGGGFPLQPGGQPAGGQSGGFPTYTLPSQAAPWEDEDAGSLR